MGGGCAKAMITAIAKALPCPIPHAPCLTIPAMAIILPFPLTAQEMRVLQEYRRIGTDSLPIDTIKSIKHPIGGGDSPALSLVAKALGDTSSPALSPLDQTANQLAEVLRSLAEPAATPSP